MAKRNRGGNSDEELPKARLSKENLKKSLRLFKYLQQNKWKFALGMFFLAGTAAVGLVFPLISGEMISLFGETGKTTPAEFTEKLVHVGKVLLLVLVIQGLFSFGRVYMFAQVTENMLRGLRNDTFKRLIQMPM
ncbi:MAG: ABC transporter transmembrane domain-containing protein, partial [Bacteroidia bacterium]